MRENLVGSCTSCVEKILYSVLQQRERVKRECSAGSQLVSMSWDKIWPARLFPN